LTGASNDHYKLIDSHFVNAQHPSIYVLHSNRIFFDALIPTRDKDSIENLPKTMAMLLVDAVPLLPTSNTIDSLIEDDGQQVKGEPNKRKSKKRKVVQQDDDEDSEHCDDDEYDEEEEWEDVILSEGQSIVNRYNKKGVVKKVTVDSQGWHLYDVQYDDKNKQSSFDYNLWGRQIRAYHPPSSKKCSTTKLKSLVHSWDMISVKSEDLKDKQSLSADHIVEGTRKRKKKIL
jgi:hypothetical protein